MEWPYYQRFIRNCSDIAEPLIKLTKKYEHFQFNDVYQAAFDNLKMKLAEIVIFAYPDPNKEYWLYTDASDQSIGTCLSQLVYDQEKLKIQNSVIRKVVNYREEGLCNILCPSKTKLQSP